MKKHSIEDIIKAERRHQWQKIFGEHKRGWSMLVFFLVLLITAVIFWITRPITPDGFFKGEVVGVYQKPSQVPRPALLVVELESGVRVTLRGSGHVKAMMGSPVLVLRSGRGLNPFRFVRYLEEGEEPPELEYDHHQEN